MVDLNVVIPTKYRLLPNRRIRRTLPENWAEVSPKQLLAYGKALRTGENAIEVRLLMARYLLKLPWYLFFVLNRVQLAQITYELRWLNEQPLTRNMFPKINRVAGRNLQGPGDRFSGMTLGEFAAASAYYDGFQRTKNPELLDYLIAVLYRPAASTRGPASTVDPAVDRTHGVARRRYATAAVSDYLPQVRKIHPDIKQAILLYFAGCLSELAVRYPLLFAAVDTATVDTAAVDTAATGQAEAGPRSDWLDFMRHLPADKFGTLEQIEQSGLHAVLEVAHRMMLDAKKEKAHAARRLR